MSRAIEIDYACFYLFLQADDLFPVFLFSNTDW